MGDDAHDRSLRLHLGPDELVIRQRYEALSIANDVLIALWFLVGSILFFWEQTMTAATWCFVLGSLEFLLRPGIRLTRMVHLRRRGSEPTESSSDF
ncbi:hypothetical protein GCM10009623_18400 [Nocardioides aestuarii]|uniref:YrhK family protein n=1 Tax=Nocardioides aestuarii TaxID=252231 RepID=A0ABW4TMQ0_9ACTN